MRISLMMLCLVFSAQAQAVKIEMTHQDKNVQHRDYGSGVVLDSGLVLTALHNIKGEEKVFVELPEGLILSTVVATDKDNDLVLLKLAIAPDKRLRVKCGEDAKLDDKILFSGCAKGLDVQPMKGKIKAVKLNGSETRCVAEIEKFDEGCSGGPLLLEGLLCGMATGYIAGEKKQCVFVPVSVIQKFLLRERQEAK